MAVIKTCTNTDELGSQTEHVTNIMQTQSATIQIAKTENIENKIVNMEMKNRV